MLFLYVSECPNRGKSARKMINVFEEQNFEILYGEEIFDDEEILYEISSDEESSDEELIFMMNDQASQSINNLIK